MKTIFRAVLLFFCWFTFSHVAFAQGTVFFYCPPGAMLSGTLELKEGGTPIASFTGARIFRHSVASGEKIFTVSAQDKSDKLKLTIENGGVYLVRCYPGPGFPKLKTEDLHSAAAVLPGSLIDSLDIALTSKSGARRVAVVKLNSYEVQNLNPVAKNDSLYVGFEEKFPLLTGQKANTLQESVHGIPRAVWIQANGTVHEQESPGYSSKVIWGVCDNGGLYYSWPSDIGKEIQIHWTIPNSVEVKLKVKGRYLGAWTEGNSFFMVTAEKGKKELRITAISDGKLLEEEDYAMPFAVIDGNEPVQFKASSFDFDDPFETARTKLYKRPGRLYITKDELNTSNDEGLPPAKSYIAWIDLSTGVVKNQALFPGNIIHGRLQTSIAGEYAIWLLRDAVIKIRSLETGKELAQLSVSEQLPQESTFLRRYDKFKPDLQREKVKTGKLDFVAGETTSDGTLLLRPGMAYIQNNSIIVPQVFSPIALAVTATSLAIRAANDAKIIHRYAYCKVTPGDKPELLQETLTVQQKADQLELVMESMGYEIDLWNYALTENSLFAVYHRKGDSSLKIYRIDR